MAFGDAVSYLAHYRALASGAQDGPFVSATFTSIQGSTGGRNAAIASYGFNPIGAGYHVGGGPDGLNFAGTRMRYSDRGGGFDPHSVDVINFSIVPDNISVSLSFYNETWDGWGEIHGGRLDPETQQLLFSGGPGAGPGAPPSLFIVSFQDRAAR